MAWSLGRRAVPVGSPPRYAARPMSERRYDPKEIEPRWQAVWADERTWEVANASGGAARRTGSDGEPDTRASSYVLEMLPYPSGEPHIGHLKVYSVGDAVAHFHRRTGRRVLHPMGFDAFGLPAENHAIKTGRRTRAPRPRPDRVVPAAVPRMGHLDRLVARVRQPRAPLLPLDAVDLPAAVRGRAGLPHATPPVNW